MAAEDPDIFDDDFSEDEGLYKIASSIPVETSDCNWLTAQGLASFAAGKAVFSLEQSSSNPY